MVGSQPEIIPAGGEAGIRSGRVSVALRISYDYAGKLQNGTAAEVKMLVDGSDSTVAGEAVNTSTGVVLEQSLAIAIPNGTLPIDLRPSILVNPAMLSANFFIPGLTAVLLQVMIVLLISLSLVRERELGTLEQLTMTPVQPLGLMVGKVIPYGILGFLELCVILIAMVVVFRVPIHGSLVRLLLMSLPFLLTVLDLGLMISTRAKSQAEAFQLSMGTGLPSVFPSGYIFLIANMPPFFHGLSRFIPVTYSIRILRGIILRGAGLSELWPNAVILTPIGITTTLTAARLFVRQKA